MGGIVLAHAPTAKEVKAHLYTMFELLASTKPTVLQTISLDEKCPLDKAYVPILIGIAARGAPDREMTSLQKRYVTRLYQMRVLFAKLKGASLEQQLEALDEADARLDEIPDWFAQFPRLELNGKAMHGVYTTGHMADLDGAELHRWIGQEWAGATYELPVTTLR